MAATLGEQIEVSRRATRKTLRSLAAELGVSPALLSLIETGQHVPTVELLSKIAVALGQDADAWCAILGKLTPASERVFADLVRENPEFFRTLRSMIEKRTEAPRDASIKSAS